jgi:hypothetical protein
MPNGPATQQPVNVKELQEWEEGTPSFDPGQKTLLWSQSNNNLLGSSCPKLDLNGLKSPSQDFSGEITD